MLANPQGYKALLQSLLIPLPVASISSRVQTMANEIQGDPNPRCDAGWLQQDCKVEEMMKIYMHPTIPAIKC